MCARLPFPSHRARIPLYAVTVTTTALLLIVPALVALYRYVPGAVPAGTVKTTFPFASEIWSLKEAPAMGFALAPVTVKAADWPGARLTAAGLTLRKSLALKASKAHRMLEPG